MPSTISFGNLFGRKMQEVWGKVIFIFSESSPTDVANDTSHSLLFIAKGQIRDKNYIIYPLKGGTDSGYNESCVKPIRAVNQSLTLKPNLGNMHIPLLHEARLSAIPKGDTLTSYYNKSSTSVPSTLSQWWRSISPTIGNQNCLSATIWLLLWTFNEGDLFKPQR